MRHRTQTMKLSWRRLVNRPLRISRFPRMLMSARLIRSLSLGFAVSLLAAKLGVKRSSRAVGVYILSAE
eukprot:14846211-Heterocapsa_arctica.AAC.1